MTAEIRTLCDIFLSAAASGKPDLLSAKVGNVWTPISARDFGYTVRALSLGLNALGVQPGDRVAMLSENRPEWAMADYAILCAGGWTVPIYPTLPAQQIVPLLKDSGAKAVFVSTLEQLGKIMQIKAQCPALDHVISMDAAPPGEPGFLTFHGLVDKGRPTLEMSPGVFEQRAARVKPDDVATIIYTSGTTGDAKGVLLTHGNLSLSHLKSQFFDQFAYVGGFIAHDGRHFFWRGGGDDRAIFGEALYDGLIVGGFDNFGVEPSNHRRRHACGTDDAEPVADANLIKADLLERGYVRHGR